MTKTIGQHVAAAKRKQKATAKPKPPKQPNRKESVVAELERLRRELKAKEAHEKKGRRLADDVGMCEASVETCKANTAAAKQKLAQAHEKLTAHTRGVAPRDVETGKQKTLLKGGKKPEGKTEPLINPRRDGAEAQAASKPLTANPYQGDEPEAAQWTAGWLETQWKAAERRKAITYGITHAALMDALQAGPLKAGEKHPKVKSISCMGYHWLVVDGWHPSAAEDASFALVQLLDKDGWRDLHQDTYGPPSDGLDEHAEAAAKRTAGGADCARVVHVESVRGDFVVAPTSSAMVLQVPVPSADRPKAAAAAASGFDAQAAAAGDDDSDEDTEE